EIRLGLARSIDILYEWGLSVYQLKMNDENTNQTDGSDDPTTTELAHSIIESLLEHTRVVSDLIAVMAQALDEDTQRALTQTSQWQAYLESRRRLETTRGEVEKFAGLMKDATAD
ncbi:MAG TPA: hypothetical protein VFD75_16645, partial [Pyrinomonadaceae bacterium]|nr:hypothetical protein [Pyrinomonadaceae bacterium]